MPPQAPRGPAPYPPYYAPYPYYPPVYPYPYGYPPAQAAPPKPLEPRQLRTAQGLDAAVFSAFVLAGAFVWSALIGGIAIAALLPTMGGSAMLGPTELSWLNGVMVARVVVWVMFLIAGVIFLASISRLHEGRAEFGPPHERKHREVLNSTLFFALLLGGAGLVVYVLSNNPPSPPQSSPLSGLQNSLRLSAMVWGAAGALGAFVLARSVVSMLKPFVPPEKEKALRVVPVVMLFVPLLHAGLSISFADMAVIETGTWSASALRAAAESGGLAGLAASFPLLVLVRALRSGHSRILSGAVPSAVIPKPKA
jgi:hypothetical protein